MDSGWRKGAIEDCPEMDIQVNEVSFTYPLGVEALHKISFEVKAGESLALIGQNGAGKTTLVKHFNGLLKPTSGRVLVGDWDTRDFSADRLARRVGYVFQNPDDQLFQSSVRAEVMFGPRNLGWEAGKIQEKVQWAMEMVHISRLAERHPYDLSPGERKQVAMASVLAMDTPIVILDEPTTGQDQAGISLVGEVIEQLKSMGKTLITITHDVDFAAEHFDRVAVMAEGKMLLVGDCREVLSNVAVLSRSYVEPPQLMRLAMNLEMQSRPRSVVEFISMWTAEVKQRSDWIR